MKKCSALLVIKGMRIKIIVRYCYKHTIEKFKVTDNIKCCQREEVTGNKPLENNLSVSYKFICTTQ